MTATHPSEARSGPGPGARRFRTAWAGIAAVLVAGLALAAGPTGQSAAPRPAASQAAAGDCQNLLKQFDVAWPAHRDSARAASARHSRDLGEADCQAGRYADAVHNLRRALHDIGVKPVKIVSPAPQH